jgi:hypothetical protein
VLAPHRPAVEGQLIALDRALEAAIPAALDLEFASRPDRQGMGGVAPARQSSSVS